MVVTFMIACAPKYASSSASSNETRGTGRAVSHTRGSAVRMPSTSFHTCACQGGLKDGVLEVEGEAEVWRGRSDPGRAHLHLIESRRGADERCGQIGSTAPERGDPALGVLA